MKDSISCNNNPPHIKSEIISSEESNGTNPKIENNQTDSEALNSLTKNEILNKQNSDNTDQNVEEMNHNIKVDGSNTSLVSNVNEIKQESKIKDENILNSDQATPEKCTTFNYKRSSKRANTENHLEEIKRARTMKDGEKSDIESNELACTKDKEYSLTISNLPNSWSFMDIKNFIDVQCGPVDEIEMIKDDNMQAAIRLIYQTETECKNVMKKLGEKFEGTKFTVNMKVVDMTQSQPGTPEPPGVCSPPPTEESTQSEEAVVPWKPDLDAWDIDPAGTYGLKESFLKSLNITPPLDRWVHVSNFRCDKYELRELAELAGRVLQCSVFTGKPRYANIMYTHPLEAVQAVSMFNRQVYYGQTLRVMMMRGPTNSILLPKALSAVGPGLGSNGRPLRTVIEHYKRFTNKQTASLNREAFDIQSSDDGLIDDEKYQVKPHDVFNDILEQIENKKTKEAESKNIEKGKTVEVKNITIIKPASPAPKPIKQRPKVHNNPGSSGNALGQGYGAYGPPKPMWSAGPGPNNRPFGPGPRPGWNGPGPMGPMQGPRPMGPPGPMGGPMRGPGLMQGLRGPGPIPGPMPGPMGGPIHGSIGGPMPHSMGGPMPGPGSMQNMSSPMQGPMGANMGAPMGPIGHQPVPMGSQPVPMGPQAVPMGSQAVPMGPQQGLMGPYKNPNEPVQLQLSNLPPSTTFALLCEKMACVGQVVSIHLTTPGAAVVTFANKMQADNCFKTYHNYCIEGYMIQVKYT